MIQIWGSFTYSVDSLFVQNTIVLVNKKNYCIRHIWKCIFRLVKGFHLNMWNNPKQLTLKGFT